MIIAMFYMAYPKFYFLTARHDKGRSLHELSRNKVLSIPHNKQATEYQRYLLDERFPSLLNAIQRFLYRHTEYLRHFGTVHVMVFEGGALP